jgi:peroxiredoxin
MARVGLRTTLLATAVAIVALGVGAVVTRGFLLNAATPDTQVVSDFSLLDQGGRFHQLSRYATARAVVLYSYDLACPTSREGLDLIQETQRGLARQNVVFLAIDANSHDDRETLARESARAGFDIPILQDDGQLVTETLHVSRSGEAMVIDPRSWRIVYRGLLGGGPKREHRQLTKAVSALLEGRPITSEARAATTGGCAIAGDDRVSMKARAISYAAEVVPILRAKCLACHRQGGIGPWPMDSYERVKTWSPRMRAVLLTGRMPPWHADPLIGTFTHDRSLSVEQKRTLVRWIDAGSARGPEADPLPTIPAPQAEEWPLGKPDLVVELPPQEIPATGTVDYRYVHIQAPVSQDAWVRAVHIAPRNPKVMHHAIMTMEYPAVWQHAQPHWHGGAGGFFATFAPGLPPMPFPPESGGFLPAGATLTFQLHYITIGEATTDVPRVALYFHARPPALEAQIVAAFNPGFTIPPGAEDYPVEAAYVLDQAVTLNGFAPHMHFRGKRFRYEAHYPDGRREVLLSVPRYDFNWQTFYLLQVPKPVPAGTKILMNGAFDNSPQNPVNPDPSKEVRWGEQTWEEMFVGYMMYTTPRRVDGARAGAR